MPIHSKGMNSQGIFVRKAAQYDVVFDEVLVLFEDFVLFGFWYSLEPWYCMWYQISWYHQSVVLYSEPG